jgi:hypothetical protein
MKPKKALKRLTRVEKLLSDVLSEYSPIDKQVDKQVRESLSSAKASVVGASVLIGRQVHSQAAPKPGAKSATPQPSRAAAAPGKKATAKAKGVRSPGSAFARKRASAKRKRVAAKAHPAAPTSADTDVSATDAASAPMMETPLDRASGMNSQGDAAMGAS